MERLSCLRLLRVLLHKTTTIIMPSQIMPRQLVFLPRVDSSSAGGGFTPVIFVPSSEESLRYTSWEIGDYNLDYGENGRVAELYFKGHFGKRKTVVTPLDLSKMRIRWKNRVDPNSRLCHYRSANVITIFTYNIDDILPYTNTIWFLSESNPIRLMLGRNDDGTITLHEFNEEDNPPIYREMSMQNHYRGVWHEIW